MSSKCSVPVLFVVFNRPDIALTSFNEIRKAAPRRLYIASDAPRETVPNEKELVEQTRKNFLLWSS